MFSFYDEQEGQLRIVIRTVQTCKFVCARALRLVNINVKYASENLTLPHGKHIHYARNIINAKVKVDKSI